MAADSNETQALELWASQEVCEALGWTRTQLARARAKDFPEPVAVVAGGTIAVWRAQDVRDWHLPRLAEERKREWRKAEAIRTYRRTGVVTAAARAVGVKDDTARAWLKAAGEVLPSERERDAVA